MVNNCILWKWCFLLFYSYILMPQRNAYSACKHCLHRAKFTCLNSSVKFFYYYYYYKLYGIIFGLLWTHDLIQNTVSWHWTLSDETAQPTKCFLLLCNSTCSLWPKEFKLKKKKKNWTYLLLNSLQASKHWRPRWCYNVGNLFQNWTMFSNYKKRRRMVLT